jgi:hypothetical protein
MLKAVRAYAVLMPLARWVWDRPRLMEAGLTFLGNVFFPRLSHGLGWRTRLGPRGTAIYAVAWVTFAVAFIWGASRLARVQERTWEEVRVHLGREPTPDEVFEYLEGQREQ